MMYKIISFYNRQTFLNPAWEVYGWRSEFNNDFLLSFRVRSAAMEYAHSFHVPVIEGDKAWNSLLVALESSHE